LKVWRGKVSHFKLLRVKVKIDRYFRRGKV
jgi:hypothetical protein